MPAPPGALRPPSHHRAKPDHVYAGTPEATVTASPDARAEIMTRPWSWQPGLARMPGGALSLRRLIRGATGHGQDVVQVVVDVLMGVGADMEALEPLDRVKLKLQAAEWIARHGWTPPTAAHPEPSSAATVADHLAAIALALGVRVEDLPPR